MEQSPKSSKFTNCVLQFSSSDEDEHQEIINYHSHHPHLNSNNLLNSSLLKKPIPTPRAKHLLTNQKLTNLQLVKEQQSIKQSHNTFNQRNLIKNLNQQQVSDSTFTPQMLHKQLFADKSNFVRTGSLDRKLQEFRKLNFSEMKQRLKQQQQQIEQNLLRKNLLRVASNEENKKTEVQKEEFKNENTVPESLILSNKPPTPPQHRHKGHVWESKFYKLALNSINQITSESSQNRYAINKDDHHWYLSNDLSLDKNDNLNFKNDFLQISQLPLYENINHAIRRIENLNEDEENNFSKEDAVDSTIIYNETEFNDYDLPPDASSFKQICITEDQTNHFYKNDQLRQSINSKFIERQVEPLEKSGYLLCNKNKKWKQKYFVLKNNCIYYYKTQTDVKKNKKNGAIKLTSDINVIKKENSSSFLLVDTNASLVYTLTADSLLTAEEWIRVIKNSLKQNGQKSVDKNVDLKGWVIRRKNGYSKKFWLILKEKKLYFYKDPESVDQQTTHLDLNEYKVLESLLENSRNSLTANDLLIENCKKEYVIGLESNLQNTVPIYLVLNDKKSFNNWLYHLTISTIENVSSLTDFEKIVYKLMSIPIQNNDYNNLDSNQLWNDHLMNYSKESLNQPLTSLDSLFLKNEALELFKSIQLFITVKIDVNSGIEYHAVLAQQAFDTCFEYRELQKELFCQLIKQSSNNSLNNSRSNNLYNFKQSFQLLSLAVSVFEAKGKVLWLLKNFLRRVADDQTEIGKYAIYCQRTLERCLTNGCREAKPSRLEILNILLRNPYQHSLPFSTPVYFSNDNYIVASFDGSTTIEEFVKKICEQTNIRPISQSGYSLYSDDPIDANKIHFLPLKCKLGDVISRWETSLKNNNLGKFESKRVTKLIFKKRLFFKSNTKTETDKEKMFFVYQLHKDLMDSKIPISNSTLYLYLTALMILFENDSPRITDEILRSGIDKFYPKKEEQLDLNNLISSIGNLIHQMGNLTKKDCIRVYLNCIKKWPIFGCNLFEAIIIESKKKVYLTVDEVYFYILDKDLKIISNYFLNKFLKFGHKEDKLIIYLLNREKCESNSSKEATTRSSFLNRNHSSTSFNNEKLEFQMDKDKINELIFLIADYLNVENGIKFELLTSESNSCVTNRTSPFEFSPTNELPNSSLYDIKQYSKLNQNDSFNQTSLNSFSNNSCLKEDEEYSEIYSPSYENNDYPSISSTFNNNSSNLPPLPPLHKCPTWENSLYKLSKLNFSQFIENTQDNNLFNCTQNDQKNLDLDQLKQRNSIGSMISVNIHYLKILCQKKIQCPDAIRITHQADF